MTEWMEDLTVKTPWGFSMEEAFEALRFRAVVTNDVDPTNKYNPDRDEYTSTNLFGDNYACKYPSCRNDKGFFSDALCKPHREKLTEYRIRKKAERKQREKEAKERYEEEKRRAHWLNTVEYQMHWREVKAQVSIIRAAKAEYREEKKARGRRYSGPPRTGYVYRLYNRQQELLYVGKTYSVSKRLYGKGGHVTKDWFPDVTAVKIAEYRSEAEALLAEGFAIREEKPKHNLAVPVQRTSEAPKEIDVYWEHVSVLARAA